MILLSAHIEPFDYEEQQASLTASIVVSLLSIGMTLAWVWMLCAVVVHAWRMVF
jgi:hypothetical protein